MTDENEPMNTDPVETQEAPEQAPEVEAAETVAEEPAQEPENEAAPEPKKRKKKAKTPGSVIVTAEGDGKVFGEDGLAAKGDSIDGLSEDNIKALVAAGFVK